MEVPGVEQTDTAARARLWRVRPSIRSSFHHSCGHGCGYKPRSRCGCRAHLPHLPLPGALLAAGRRRHVQFGLEEGEGGRAREGVRGQAFQGHAARPPASRPAAPLAAAACGAPPQTPPARSRSARGQCSPAVRRGAAAAPPTFLIIEFLACSSSFSRSLSKPSVSNPGAAAAILPAVGARAPGARWCHAGAAVGVRGARPAACGALPENATGLLAIQLELPGR